MSGHSRMGRKWSLVVNTEYVWSHPYPQGSGGLERTPMRRRVMRSDFCQQNSSIYTEVRRALGKPEECFKKLPCGPGQWLTRASILASFSLFFFFFESAYYCISFSLLTVVMACGTSKI